MDIAGYINPRILGNSEPNEMLQMDVFFEEALWKQYIDVTDSKLRPFGTSTLRDIRTYDVVHMFRVFGAPNFGAGASETTFPCCFGGEFGGQPDEEIEVSLRAYCHPKYLALCVGLADS